MLQRRSRPLRKKDFFSANRIFCAATTAARFFFVGLRRVGTGWTGPGPCASTSLSLAGARTQNETRGKNDLDLTAGVFGACSELVVSFAANSWCGVKMERQVSGRFFQLSCVLRDGAWYGKRHTYRLRIELRCNGRSGWTLAREMQN